MPDPAPLGFEAHLAWVRRTLVEGGESAVYLVRRRGVPVGFTLLKRLAPGVVEIGAMFVAGLQRTPAPAMAGVLATHLAMERLGAHTLVTYAHRDHALALALNRGLGALECESDKPGECCFRTPAAHFRAHPAYTRVLRRVLGRVAF
jgi:hypothetical protein